MARPIDMKRMHTDVIALEIVVGALAKRMSGDNNFIRQVQVEFERLKADVVDAAEVERLQHCVDELINP